MKKLKVAVIGAGPAGLTAAYTLAKSENIDVHLYEAAPHVGGMSASFDLWNQIVDIGPHRFFSSDPRVNELWLEVIERDYVMVNRLTRIFYRNRFFYYPLKAFNALWNLGFIRAAMCVLSYAWRRLAPYKDESNFEAWVSNRFGDRLYRIFFKTYSEKLWGIRCDDLDADFAAQRIKKLSLYEAIKKALFQGKGNKHKTLVDQFAYPTKGTGSVYEKMAKKFEENGGKLFLKTPIKRVTLSNHQATGIIREDDSFEDYDHVISSMPLTLMVSRLDGVPSIVQEACSKLSFRNTIIVYLRIEGENLFPDQWLYVHSDNLAMGRVTNFSNWTPTLQRGEKDTILALEYWCYEKDDFWKMSNEDLINQATREITATGLHKNCPIVSGHVLRVNRSYPVYDSLYKENVQVIETYLRTLKGLDVIGRYGAFKYNNQDHSILMGLFAAENLIEGKLKNDLWSINTDYEYQESSTITESGLVY